MNTPTEPDGTWDITPPSPAGTWYVVPPSPIGLVRRDDPPPTQPDPA